MLIDVVPLFNELDLYELRLRVLSPIVDRFLVIQAEETHSGLPKPIYFDPQAARWAPWRNRLATVIIPRMATTDRWEREHAARHAMVPALVAYADDDLVLIADCDEIPDPRVVLEHRAQAVDPVWVGFRLRVFYYYLNLRLRPTFDAVALAQVKTVRRLGAQALRDGRRRPPIGPCGGGWHFSYMGGIPAIQMKLAAFAHAEYDTDRYRNAGYIAERIRARRELFGPNDGRFERVPLEDLPLDVQQHPDRYRSMLLEAAA